MTLFTILIVPKNISYEQVYKLLKKHEPNELIDKCFVGTSIKVREDFKNRLTVTDLFEFISQHNVNQSVNDMEKYARRLNDIIHDQRKTIKQLRDSSEYNAMMAYRSSVFANEQKIEIKNLRSLVKRLTQRLVKQRRELTAMIEAQRIANERQSQYIKMQVDEIARLRALTSQRYTGENPTGLTHNMRVSFISQHKQQYTDQKITRSFYQAFKDFLKRSSKGNTANKGM